MTWQGNKEEVSGKLRKSEESIAKREGVATGEGDVTEEHGEGSGKG
jgi:hypothetical protein